jgi:hypothetical protein
MFEPFSMDFYITVNQCIPVVRYIYRLQIKNNLVSIFEKVWLGLRFKPIGAPLAPVSPNG